jgi:hypothetical protein
MDFGVLQLELQYGIGSPIVHFALWGVVFCLDLGPFFFLLLFPCRGLFIYLCNYLFHVIWEVPLLIFHLHLLKKNLMQLFAVGKKPMLLQYIFTQL